MPRLAGQKIDLSSSGKSRTKPKGKQTTEDEEDEEEQVRTPNKGKSAAPKTQQRSRRLIPQDDEEEDDDDEAADNGDDEEDDDVISSAVRRKREGKTPNLKLIAGGAVVVVLVIFCFLIFGGNRSSNPTVNNPPPEGTTNVDTSVPPEEPTLPPTIPDDTNVGTQNFLEDTTMVSDSALTDPNNYIKDLYGLSTQVNYTVSKISTATDFVSYTKYRGTWGGGLELYYLDVEYKGNQYVIQVPFQYYKELDDVGIVPVKMEVLRVLNETDGSYLTIISYMCLDENTLNAVLKTQQK